MRTRLILVVAVAVMATLAPPAMARPAVPVPPTVYHHLAGLPAAAGPTVPIPDPLGHGHDDADDAHVSTPAETPIPFSMVGFDGVEHVRFRTSLDGETWSDWYESEPVDGGPDAAEARDVARRGGSVGGDLAAAGVEADTGGTEPVWVGAARYLQIATEHGSPADVGVHLVDSAGLSRSLAGKVADHVTAALRATGPAADAAAPSIVTRAQWGADESLRRGSPRYADDVRFGAVHHTVNANDYSRDEVPAMLRGIYRYHTQALGWDDIGYNAVVDRFGRVYEGRSGGISKGVIGAHAAGFNAGSFGVSVLGTFTSQQPSAEALNALTSFVAWKFGVHGIDPSGKVTVTSGGSNKFPSGTEVRLHTLVGHRDLGKTACPGDRLYELMGSLRATVAGIDGTVTPPSTTTFSDIGDSPHAANIEALVAAGVTQGCAPDRYCPHARVTRGQMASFLLRAFDHLEAVSGQQFSDVPAEHVHAAAVNGLVAAGVANGYSDGTFRPDQPINRGHMAVFIQRAVKLDLVWGFPFVDIPQDDVFIRPRANAIAAAGITKGCAPDRFCPDDPVKRAQMASFLVRSLSH